MQKNIESYSFVYSRAGQVGSGSRLGHPWKKHLNVIFTVISLHSVFDIHRIYFVSHILDTQVKQQWKEMEKWKIEDVK